MLRFSTTVCLYHCLIYTCKLALYSWASNRHHTKLQKIYSISYTIFQINKLQIVQLIHCYFKYTLPSVFDYSFRLFTVIQLDSTV